MPSKKLIGFWAFFDTLLLAAGAIAIIFSLLWNMSNNPLRHLVITKAYLTAGLVLGVMLLVTFALSIGAIIQPNHVTLPLAILNWAVIVDALTVIVIGTMIWWPTLQERDNFGKAFNATSDDTKLALQNMLQCCGYFFNNETGNVIKQGFCGDEKNFSNSSGCVDPITAYADVTLNDIFTTIYGYMGVLAGVFIGTLCVIKTRHEAERFRRIDAKRGGRGFV
jgi:asparagine N-glycosylation enzyme membrane subunit Stt3